MGVGKKTPRLARFIGHGNVFVDGRRVHGWQVRCAQCSQTKLVTCSGTSSLPPEVIIKKLTKTGWKIGNKPTDDVCDACQRKPVASHIGLAKQALSFAAAPVVSNGHATMHYSELEALALKLPVDQLRQLIKALREALPQPVHKPKPQPVASEADAEYMQWLEQQK